MGCNHPYLPAFHSRGGLVCAPVVGVQPNQIPILATPTSQDGVQRTGPALGQAQVPHARVCLELKVAQVLHHQGV
jgi:hypothetical protein